MGAHVRLQVVESCSSHRFHEKKPRRGWPGLQSGGAQIRSVAAVHQPPARTPGGADQAPHIAAAAIAISAAVIGRTADDDARAAPTPTTMMPTVMPAAAPGRGGGRR